MAAISGGDSSVAATLIHPSEAVELHCVFIDTGLMRENEASESYDLLQRYSIKCRVCITNQMNFLKPWTEVTDPEEKRENCGRIVYSGFH